MHPFTAGNVLSRSFSVWMRGFLPLTAIGVGFQIPFHFLESGRILLGDGYWSRGFLTWQALGLLSLMLPAAAMAHSVRERLQGRPTPLLTTLLIGPLKGLIALPVVAVMALVVALGLQVLIVPGLVVLCLVWVAVPVTVLEVTGPVRALLRSVRLTRGVRWRIFGIQALLVVLWFALAQVVGLVFLVVPGILGNPAELLGLAFVGATGMISTWGGIAVTVSYHDLTGLKEHRREHEIAAIFE